jgi:murein DD-endopeptidase MepM/ murein hydrolase activator NlpD
MLFTMRSRWSRRGLLAAAAGSLVAPLTLRADQAGTPWISAPIGWPDAEPGDGFRIGHGFQCENSWFSPDWWHTGEDWYATTGDTAGAVIRAVAAGEVVYADFDYPGRVVIVQHAEDLFSLYGHLEYDLAVRTGETVAPGAVLGTVLQQADRRAAHEAPSHLHFEMRRFLIRDDVNGASPGYGVNCGYQCPPGPGYWPMSAPDLPVDKGWLNPLHTRIRKATADGVEGLAIRPQAAAAGMAFPLRERPDVNALEIGSLSLEAGTTIAISDIAVGEPVTRETTAAGYSLWLQVAPDGGDPGWLQAALPSDDETGADGSPSSIDLPFLLATG